MPGGRDHAAVFADPASFGTTLAVALVDLAGTAALSWDPLAVAMEVQAAAGVDVTPANFSKLMAAAAVVTTDRFARCLPDFIAVCNALSGHGLSPGVFDPAEAEDVAWGVTEALLLESLFFGRAGDAEPLSEEVRRYVGKVLDREGIMDPPDVLAVALRDDRGRARRVAAQHAGDPDLLALIRGVEAAKAGGITDHVRDGLRTLVNQLTTMSLTSGDARALLERLSPPDPTTQDSERP